MWNKNIFIKLFDPYKKAMQKKISYLVTNERYFLSSERRILPAPVNNYC